MLLFVLILLSTSFSFKVHWEPEFPQSGESVSIYCDVSEDHAYKYSFPMYINILNNHQLEVFPMNLDYLKGVSNWKYTFIINDNIQFSINNVFVNDINQVFNYNIKISQEELLLKAKNYLKNKDYNNCMMILNELSLKYKDQELGADAEYMIAEIYLNDFQNYILAAYHYTNILDNYSNSFKTSKKSLFSLAYVYANYLDYYSDAFELYNQFIDLYPNDELIPSIKYELENLNKFQDTIDTLINSSK